MKRIRRNIYVLGIMLTLAITGCGSNKSGVVLRNDGYSYGAQQTYEAASPAPSAEAAQTEGTQPSETGESESTQPSDKAADSGSAQAPEVSGPVKKQPPEGLKLNFDTPEWGLLFGEQGTQPLGNAPAEDLAWYNSYFIGSESEKVIYLTFDCGFENGNTGMILDALKKHDAPATFFVLGYFLETAPDIVKRMVDEGHTVGNHTYNHPNMVKLSDETYFKKELTDVEDKFYEITGQKLSPYYRPPEGRADEANIKMANDMGYYTIFWSLAYVDWDQNNQPGRAEAIEKLTSRIHPGAVVLLHNISRTNAEILDELLTKWEDMGYSLRPLSELVSEE